jgi:hypothetical protein
MGILALAADERIAAVRCTKAALSVKLMDGRTITVPLVWYPRLLKATKTERENWHVCAAGYGIHWPDLDEDLSTEGLLRGAPSPEFKAGGVSLHRRQSVKRISPQSASRTAPRRRRRSSRTESRTAGRT